MKVNDRLLLEGKRHGTAAHVLLVPTYTVVACSSTRLNILLTVDLETRRLLHNLPCFGEEVYTVADEGLSTYPSLG